MAGWIGDVVIAQLGRIIGLGRGQVRAWSGSASIAMQLFMVSADCGIGEIC